MSKNYESLCNNMLNGNWSTAKKTINNYSKLDLLNLIEFMVEYNGSDYKQSIKEIRIAIK